jgi:flagellar motility protein MotE (MotC chaperone)
MMLARSATRLLPWTICAMALLLVVKSVSLVRAAVPGGMPAPANVVPAARAEGLPKPGEPQKSGEPRAAASAPPAKLSPPPPPAAPLPAQPDGGASQISDSERTLLLDLRRRSGELDAREAALAGREAVMSAAEKRLGARLDELTSLQHRLEALEAARKDRDEASWRGLVKVYETMKPRDAAAIFNDLDLPVLLQVVDRMKESKAAPVLAAMQPERARQLTAELSQMRARANTVSAAPPLAVAAPPVAVAAPGRVANPAPGGGSGGASGTASGSGIAAAGNGKGKT